ncbi:multidrug efflux SMR transporter [Paenibacillus sp. ACRRX]|uniref:DMT family transporter n=1 Tax=unclassified Paenibacillus TaxID=185978 RepID=UPI001EF3F3C1|nr:MULTISPECIES: multidrug efflux SMR transporter [unclassified Paenibacillus]MCG7408075.1 multidrug efflux SMR transporter [Paenibacillus sp. ACRRX]MDK8181542.1 multidrug efflux SMR transporter [Paenibacillus sp. UMB4589-SE434]
MAWIALIVAGLCEVAGVLAIKRATTNPHWTSYVYMALTFGVSFSMLSYAMESISMGTAYAIWTGIGTAGSTLLGMFVFGEQKSAVRVGCIALIVGSVVGLKLIA